MPVRMVLIGVLGFRIPTMLRELLNREHSISLCCHSRWKIWVMNANEQ